MRPDPDADKESKEDAHYAMGAGLDACRNCVFFFPNARRCAKVAGPIEPDYWCRHFKERR